MKQKHVILSAAIATALAGTPCGLLAGSLTNSAASAATSRSEMPRITQTVDSNTMVTIPKTHPDFVARLASNSSPLVDTAVMNHLQLVLKPSAARLADLETLIADQHNPKSAQFDHWLTPQQFGDAFGVVDSDIASVTSWLTSQGFTVNSVYPNKTQIDFSGTVAQVNRAFHIQEMAYTVGKSAGVASTRDISIPAAFQAVVAGVSGLNDLPTGSPSATLHKMVQGQSSSLSGNPFQQSAATSAQAGSKRIGQAITTTNGYRALVPNDMATMYGIRTIRGNGVTGKGVTVALVETENVVTSEWDNFVSVFNLTQFGGSFQVSHPAPASGSNNCTDPAAGPGYYYESGKAAIDAEWTTAIAPGANVVVASCANPLGVYYPNSGLPNPGESDNGNVIGGVFIAASNLINGATRPDVISTGFNFSEFYFDNTSKTQIDQLWTQADAEGISVYVAAGNSATDAAQFDFSANDVTGEPGLNVNGIASSPHVTVVGGTDLADVLDGTTNQYFASKPSVVGGSALSYVPEIPWNESCGNGVAAKSFGFSGAVAFCQEIMKYDTQGYDITEFGTSGGASMLDAKPAWQRQVYNAANDQSRDIPDVALFGGSWGAHTFGVVCITSYPCSPDFSTVQSLDVSDGTSMSSAMFSGIQALMDQGLQARGLPLDQGNAAPTLYALAASEYGGPTGPQPASLATCNANNGASGTASCVFHNVTRGDISQNCFDSPTGPFPLTVSNCYFYGNLAHFFVLGEAAQVGLYTIDAAPTSYGPGNKAYGAQPGWSFAAGLGSVNATNLLIAWRAFANASITK